ncbi:selenoprotein S [Pseudophryne corroboree]|uniref:selenoprotein S n=1 Tax=Pseudophryne corroboree TaxID=495146 RepID=UPI003081BCBC
MELGDREVPADNDMLELDMPTFLLETVGTTLSNYGWLILFACIGVYLLKQKLSDNINSLLTTTSTSVADPEVVLRREEAVAAARLKMQEELNTQAEKFKEKQKQLEEEKRNRKIQSWESMKEGKSYKMTSSLSQPDEPSSSTSTSSSSAKPKPDRKPLRGSGFNPLTGDGGGACAWRPGRRGPSSGG